MSGDKRACDRLGVTLASIEGWSEEIISQALRKHKSGILRHLYECTSTKIITANNYGLDSLLNSTQSE